MSKLSDFSLEEIEAVYQHFFGDTNIKRGDLTPKQMLELMNSFNGSRIVLSMRVGKLGQEIKRAFFTRIRDNRITIQATADAMAKSSKSLVTVIHYSDNQKSIYIAGRRIK